ncbi:hypothetical protein KUTeg_002826 [Tegillarca granosa]|uniref:C-type lectin domain-containing protein n=1 Tax=Tegillarca granosa TaxID=220873 RepID=A0ABQ9FQR8_TEGGR|nr:hypothetical protein KUTeg_002826 [Tegillarca granosa]
MLCFLDPKKATVRYWLGGTDIAVEGHWEWASSGQQFDYTHWHPGQPDNANSNEHCLDMTGHMDFDWNDMVCTLKFYFICERE